MTIARSVEDVIRDHVVLEYEAIDRIYLNVFPSDPGKHAVRTALISDRERQPLGYDDHNASKSDTLSVFTGGESAAGGGFALTLMPTNFHTLPSMAKTR